MTTEPKLPPWRGSPQISNARLEEICAYGLQCFEAGRPQWISVDERLPEDETPVLILHCGVVRIGELRWDHPGFEDAYQSYRYWDDPTGDGMEWQWGDVTHWMPLPSPPKA